MSATLSEDTLIEAVRSSSPATRARLLQELLSGHVRQGTIKRPPPITDDREVELNNRLNQLDEAQDFRDYIDKLG